MPEVKERLSPNGRYYLRDSFMMGHYSEFGRSTTKVKCPFCSVVTTCYLWSLYGSGKRCSCGAVHHPGVTAMKIKIKTVVGRMRSEEPCIQTLPRRKGA